MDTWGKGWRNGEREEKRVYDENLIRTGFSAMYKIKVAGWAGRDRSTSPELRACDWVGDVVHSIAFRQ